jgi:dipeptidyl aminopeptidase/acylaminoacyl peptidase
MSINCSNPKFSPPRVWSRRSDSEPRPKEAVSLARRDVFRLRTNRSILSRLSRYRAATVWSGFWPTIHSQLYRLVGQVPDLPTRFQRVEPARRPAASLLSRRTFTATAALCLTTPLAAQSASEPPIRPAAGSELENFPDGSTGRISEFRGAEGTFIAAYLRQPKGAGPFPVVVILHGGAASKDATYGMARNKPPAADFVAAGWAVLAIDFRPTTVPLTVPGGAIVFPALPPIEVHDTLAAIEEVRHLPFIDGKRVAVMGGSHGGYVMSKVVSRADLRCAILCSPAIFDLIELSKALDQKVDMIQTIKNKIAEGEQKYGATMAAIAKNPAAYGYESPMTEVSKVRSAIMIINGRNDTSSPVTVMETYADKLRALGKEVETYLPEDAPHGFYFASPKPLHPQTDEAARRAVAFIRKQFDR